MKLIPLLLLCALPTFAKDPKPSSHAQPAPQIVRITNVVIVTVTNAVSCPASDLAITDYALTKGHLYRLWIIDPNWSWKASGVIKATSNHLARIVLPVASFKPTLWQLIDTTPGYQKQAVIPSAQSCDQAVTYIGLSRRLIRVPDNRP